MATKTTKKAAAKKATPKAAAKNGKAAKSPKAGYDQKQVRNAANLLKHVSDPTRLMVVSILANGEQNVGDIAGQLSQSQPAVSHHLALLRHGGIIEPRRQGKNNFYALTDKGAALHKSVLSMLNN